MVCITIIDILEYLCIFICKLVIFNVAIYMIHSRTHTIIKSILASYSIILFKYKFSLMCSWTYVHLYKIYSGTQTCPSGRHCR